MRCFRGVAVAILLGCNSRIGELQGQPGYFNHRTVSANEPYLLPRFVKLVYHHLPSGKQGTDKAGVRAMKILLSNPCHLANGVNNVNRFSMVFEQLVLSQSCFWFQPKSCMIWSILALELVTKKENISSSLASSVIVTHSIPGFRMFQGTMLYCLCFKKSKYLS